MNTSIESHDFSHLLPPTWKKQIKQWIENDIPSFDIGGFVVGEKEEMAFLLGKSYGILAGVPFFNAVFDEVNCRVEWLFQEGSIIDPSTTDDGKVIVAKVYGKCRNILLGERTGLNILTRASGIANEAKKAVDLSKSLGWHGEVAGTRKTTPGFRLVEKYALLIGGASTHRYDLSSMVMLKDNHIWSAGSITKAVQKARTAGGFSIKIEVECRSLVEAIEAGNAGADIVMLDNFESENLKETAETLKAQFPKLIIEASGGITMETMDKYLSPHVDVISQGRLTQGYPCVDFSLKIQRKI